MTEPTVRLTVLCEDTTQNPRLAAEHGLSILVETTRHRVLLDTGAGTAFLRNAEAMGVSLVGLDAVVLSHGHYDHTGGLGALLQAVGRQKIVAHPAVFRPRLARGKTGAGRSIGPPLTQAAYEQLGADFEFTAEPFWWDDEIATTGQVPEAFPDRRPGHLCAEIDGSVVPDDFADDMSLMARLPEGIVVVTGCAHAGLRNIVQHAVEVTGASRVHAIVGGTHLIAYDVGEVQAFAGALSAAGVEALAPCHCTGSRAISQLEGTFSGPVIPVRTGDVARFSPAGDLTVAAWASALG